MAPFVINQVKFADCYVQDKVPGGTGLYAALGARAVTAKNESSKVGCIVIAGYDFPDDVLGWIQSWGMNLLVHRETGKTSTRGLLKYHDKNFAEKTFSFFASPLLTQVFHLHGSPLLGASAFHFLEVPDILEVQINQLRSTRTVSAIGGVPKIVWEPKPSACQSNGLDSHLRACKLVDVFSPTHIELQSLIGCDINASFSRVSIESCAEIFLASGISSTSAGYVVVRCGKYGNMARSRQGFCQWFPPYHTSTSHVVDATGSGISFLGGFTVGMIKSGGDITEGMIYGTVAASLVIEQFGLPTCQASASVEVWNDLDVEKRIREYRQRIRPA
ncbi:unnamed protein product [Clonostachys solani]|uniref:Carbohydrate kinase PfkB domain-containing protein n=1 Tax=Clonostachys solani TaxID=160281 RepID=A0A9N9ZN67_9HYPO|nr:unnamed protein product [Clonostachys solani]